MNEKTTPTPGPWKLMKAGRDECGERHCFDYVRVAEGRVITTEGRSGDEANANAALIAETGTVYHETGLTTRQLAEQRKELMEALEAVIDQCDGYVPNTSKAVWRAAQQALAHARGEKP